MVKIIDRFIAQTKAKKQNQYKLLLRIGLTWKVMNPKSLQELKTES